MDHYFLRLFIHPENIREFTEERNYEKKCPGQKIYFVIVEGYIYLVPHIIEKEYIFLKTIIPNRKATNDYQKEQEG